MWELSSTRYLWGGLTMTLPLALTLCGAQVVALALYMALIMALVTS